MGLGCRRQSLPNRRGLFSLFAKLAADKYCAASARGDAEDALCRLLAGKKSQEDDDWEDIWEVLG